MSRAGATSKVNVLFFVFVTVFPVPTVAFCGPLLPLSPLEPAVSLLACFFFLVGRSVFMKKYSFLSPFMRGTEYVVAKRVTELC